MNCELCRGTGYMRQTFGWRRLVVCKCRQNSVVGIKLPDVKLHDPPVFEAPIITRKKLKSKDCKACEGTRKIRVFSTQRTGRHRSTYMWSPFKEKNAHCPYCAK